jgi:hypothetical protein
MLGLEPAAVERSSFWSPGAAFSIIRDDAAIGRIDIGGPSAARITIRDDTFECRINPTGKARWNYVPSRWVMCSGETLLHAATWESNKVILIDGEQPLRLLKESGSLFAVERALDQVRLGEIRWEKRQLVPKSVSIRVVFDMSLDLAERFEVFLLWVAAQDSFRRNFG